MDRKFGILCAIGGGSILLTVALYFLKMDPLIFLAPLGIGAVVMIILIFVKLPDRLPSAPTNTKSKEQTVMKPKTAPAKAKK